MMSPESFMLVDSFTVDSPGPIRARAKRYVPQFLNTGNDTPKKAQVILLFAHALGFHKEHWEPVINELFQEDNATGLAMVKEAWAIDCPDHGESALLNETELGAGKRYVSCYEYGDLFISLIRSGLMNRECKLIFVGHSAGAISGILSAPRFDLQSRTCPYSSMILVEPAIISQDLLATDPSIQKMVTQLIASSATRRDIWPSVADAKSWLVKRSPWKLWDPRILDIYVRFGMRPLPTRLYPNVETGVTLSLPRLAHGLSYGNLQDQHDGVDQLKAICRDSNHKVRVLFGTRIDYNPKAVQDEIESIVKGSHSGNVSYIKGVGHMIIQEDPARVAKALYGILHNDFGNVSGKL